MESTPNGRALLYSVTGHHVRATTSATIILKEKINQSVPMEWMVHCSLLVKIDQERYDIESNLHKTLSCV